MKSTCEQLLRDHSARHWTEWGKWLLSDPTWGLLRWEMPDVVRKHVISELNDDSIEERRDRHRLCMGGDRHPASFAALDIWTAPAETSVEAAAYWHAEHGVNLWPRLRARIGMDVDGEVCRDCNRGSYRLPDCSTCQGSGRINPHKPFLQEILATDYERCEVCSGFGSLPLIHVGGNKITCVECHGHGITEVTEPLLIFADFLEERGDPESTLWRASS